MKNLEESHCSLRFGRSSGQHGGMRQLKCRIEIR